jgi:tetratricopeptide (TPR) repeat protein
MSSNLLKMLKVAAFALVFSGCHGLVPTHRSLPAEADELRKNGNHEEAIEVLRRHISQREADESRPAWENPYFYELEIGDIYLEEDKTLDAITTYESAEKHNVEAGLVADRFRELAEKYRTNKQYDEAIALLKAHRALDPLLFDNAMDLIAKEAVKQEEGK